MKKKEGFFPNKELKYNIKENGKICLLRRKGGGMLLMVVVQVKKKSAACRALLGVTSD